MDEKEMTIIDQFASQIIIGLLAHQPNGYSTTANTRFNSTDDLARVSYRYAIALYKEKQYIDNLFKGEQGCSKEYSQIENIQKKHQSEH